MRLSNRHFVFAFKFLFFSIGLTFSPALAAESPLDYKIFTYSSALWITEPSGITLYQSDTRNIRGIVLCDTIEKDSILDRAENSSILWVLSQSGVYQIDYATTTVEKLPGGKFGINGNKLAVDDDYLWVALKDTLWRFDKLGREWFPYPMNLGDKQLFGMYSNGTNVYCVLPSTVKIFSTKDEKWREFPDKKGMAISPQSRFFIDKNTLILVDSVTIYRYLIQSQSWDVITAGAPIVDMLSQDTALYYQTTSAIYRYNTTASIAQPFEIRGVGDAQCFTVLLGDTALCPANRTIIKYAISSKTTDGFQGPQDIPDSKALKAIVTGTAFTVLYPQALSSFDSKLRIWQTFSFGGGGAKRKAFSWDNNGLKLRYGQGYETQLHGSVRKEYLIDSVVVNNDTATLTYTDKNPIANLSLHTVFPEGRYFDAFFDNSNLTQVPKKGLFFRGAAADRIESARVGTNNLDIAQSKAIPQAQFEGGSAVLQSKSSLANRDRRIVKAQVGTGLLLTKTIYKVFPYSETGTYNIKDSVDNTKEIVPGTLKVAIDGEDIDSGDCMLIYKTGQFKFNKDDLMDPTSVITVSYQIRTVPDSGVQHVEWVPENHFGDLGYASVTVSPTDWISPQAGFYYLQTDRVHRLVNFGAPMELRTSSPALFFKLNPALTLDEATGQKAAEIALQSRYGEKLSVFANALLPDSGYKTTNILNRGYGYLKHDLDYKIAYDIKKELPVSYYQHDIASRSGIEQRYELAAGAHFLGFPFCDLTLSRNVVNGNRSDTSKVMHIDSTLLSHRDTAILDSVTYDTLDRIKNKFKVRLYETSSPFVESVLHINRFKYELSYTGYASQTEKFDGTGYGNVIYSNITISPIQRISLTILGTYLNNPPGSQFNKMYTPSFIFQSIDAPKGCDISARNEIVFNSPVKLIAVDTLNGMRDTTQAGSCVNTRNIALTLRPGSWVNGLAWISPILGYMERFKGIFVDPSPAFTQMIFGTDYYASKTTTVSAGANIFPTNNITWRNDNKWTTADSTTKYYSYNDVKWWFSDKRLLQVRWEYDRDRPIFNQPSKLRDWQRGFLQYTDYITYWLQIQPTFLVSYVGLDTTFTLSDGPQLTFSIAKQNFYFIKNIVNSHTFSVSWNRKSGEDAPGPDFSYSLRLNMIIFPNISIDTDNSLLLSNGAFKMYKGSFAGTLTF
jgi:hypothetical protein